MTLEMALITHRLVPGSWFRRVQHAQHARWRLVGGVLEGMSDQISRPVRLDQPVEMSFVPGSLAADDWIVVLGEEVFT